MNKDIDLCLNCQPLSDTEDFFMINTLSVHSSLEAAQAIADKLPDNTLESVHRLYTVLLALSFDVIEEKAYRAIPTHVTYHSSLTLVAAVAGMNRITCWRSLARLKALGLVDWRSHKVMFRGRASNSGTVFQVRLNPGAGTRARLSYDDLKHSWKDLERAARCKRLAGTMLKHINTLESKSLRYEIVKQWTLEPYTDKNPVIPYRLQPSLEAVLGVSSAQGKEVVKQVDLAAQALATALQDKKSTDFYRKLLWGLQRRTEATGANEFHSLYLQVNRVIKGDIPEWEGLRSPPALLISRLKKYSWWQECMTV
jgi:hypothetical protein